LYHAVKIGKTMEKLTVLHNKVEELKKQYQEAITEHENEKLKQYLLKLGIKHGSVITDRKGRVFKVFITIETVDLFRCAVKKNTISLCKKLKSGKYGKPNFNFYEYDFFKYNHTTKNYEKLNN
jgi:hypothetical protein